METLHYFSPIVFSHLIILFRLPENTQVDMSERENVEIIRLSACEDFLKTRGINKCKRNVTFQLRILGEIK